MRNLPIIKETADFIAVSKPSGLLSIPDRYNEHIPSALSMLRSHYNEVYTVHRLDRLTSGLLLFARNAETHQYLSSLFEQRDIQKTYTGIVTGRMTETEGTIDAAIAEHPYKKGEMVVVRKGKPSITAFETLSTFSHYSVVNFRPVSGRTHQIRVHAKHIHHPLACDPVYGDGKPVYLSSFKRKFRLGKNELEERPLLSRLALHASSLRFTAGDGQHFLLEAPLPKDMNAVVQQLHKNA